MKLQHLVSLVLAASAAAVPAQPANPFLGKWRASWEGGHKPLTAALEITESGGSWKTLAFAKKNPCLGQTAPISIVSSSPEKLVLELKYSEAYAGCPDTKVVLMRAGDGTITGKRGHSELQLSRE